MKTFEEYFKKYHPNYDVVNNTYKVRRIYPVHLCKGDMETLYDMLMEQIEERDQRIAMLESIGSYDPSEF